MKKPAPNSPSKKNPVRTMCTRMKKNSRETLACFAGTKFIIEKKSARKKS